MYPVEREPWSVISGATTIVVVALALRPPLSVTDAVRTCVPGTSVPPARVPLEPSGPWTLELHPTAPEGSPSSVSVAPAVSVTGSSGANVAPLAGATSWTVGAALTTSVSVATALLPPRSVTEALIVCVPERSVETTEVPVPSVPSRFDVQTIAVPRSPSSASSAVPVSVIVSVGANRAPSAGPVIRTVGAAFTTSTIAARAVLPPASTTVAVIVWVPDRKLLTSVAPVPSAPSRSDVHATPPPRFPSSRSVAAAESVIESVGPKSEPSAGASIETCGAAFDVTVTSATAVRPPLSCTAAVIVWRPERSMTPGTTAPAPSGPSRLDVHSMAPPRSPSSTSVAVATRDTASAGLTVNPLVGVTIDSRGAALTITVIAAAADFPPPSVTCALITCVPERSPSTFSMLPPPSGPSRLDVQRIAVPRSPSSASFAIAVSGTTSPGTNVAPSCGEPIRSAGGAFTTTVMAAVVVRPALSVTDAVTV